MTRRIGRRIILGWIGAASALALSPRPAAADGIPEWYTLANAARENRLDAARSLLSSGADPNFADSSGRSPLDYAAIQGNTAMVTLLVSNGARVDFRDSFGATALHWAAENGRVDVIEQLLAAHAPVDAQNKQGITPLMLAASNDHAQAVRALLRGGANLKKQDFTGRDAAGWAQGNPRTLRLLRSSSG